MAVLVLFLCLLFFSFPHKSLASDEVCAPSYDDLDGSLFPPVTFQFPFVASDFDRYYRGGYPGFNLTTCVDGTPTISFPFSGNFTLLETNYHTQIITISDPDGCLPNRILTLNLTGSPFSAAASQHYTFLNCTEGDPLARVRVGVRDAVAVPCLSSENFTVHMTTSAVSSELAGQCRLVKSVSAPIMSFPSDLTRFDPGPCFMHLRWDVPDCRRCVFESGRSICGFESKSGLQVGCTGQTGLLDLVPFLLCVGAVVGALMFACGLETEDKACEKLDKLSLKLKRQTEYLGGLLDLCGWMMKKWLHHLMDWLVKPKED